MTALGNKTESHLKPVFKERGCGQSQFPGGETYVAPQDPALTGAPRVIQGSAVVLLEFSTICEHGGPCLHFLLCLANYVAGSRSGSRSGQERTSSQGKESIGRAAALSLHWPSS